MPLIQKVTTKTQPIWPDKTIYATVFADQPPTPDHATPQTADPSWNSLVDALQDLIVGHHHDGVDSRLVAVSAVETQLIFGAAVENAALS